MPIDPTGTTPQPPATSASLPQADIKCRRGDCDSTSAFVMAIPQHPNQRLYRCVKCHHTWGVNVGGHIDI